MTKQVKKDSLGDRMKEYEQAFRTYLTRRVPVIVRIDGCHFHTYTKGSKKPFDDVLAEAFWKTSISLCEQISGVKLAYHQSDEISLLITNDEQYNTEAWYKNNLQKIVSVAASIATARFNQIMMASDDKKNLATFDARAFVLPKEEVENYFIWRQQDAIKNSVSMLAQSEFSHKSLQGINAKKMKEKLLLERNLDWNDIDPWKQRGVVIKKQYYQVEDTQRTRWIVDHDIPVFTQEREYIHHLLHA